MALRPNLYRVGTVSSRPNFSRPSAEAIRESYAAAAEGYDAPQGFRRSLRFRIIEAPLRRIARSGRVLEIGCGTGRLLAQTGTPRRIGVDLSPEMLQRAAGRQLDVACADAHQLPFASESFDAVIAGNATFRYLDYARAFRECSRVLVAGGRLGVHQYSAVTWTPSILWRRRRWSQSMSGICASSLSPPPARASRWSWPSAGAASGFFHSRCRYRRPSRSLLEPLRGGVSPPLNSAGGQSGEPGSNEFILGCPAVNFQLGWRIQTFRCLIQRPPRTP